MVFVVYYENYFHLTYVSLGSWFHPLGRALLFEPLPLFGGAQSQSGSQPRRFAHPALKLSKGIYAQLTLRGWENIYIIII